MSKATEMSLIHKQEFDEQHADILHHHISQMYNPESFMYDIRLKRIKKMEAAHALAERQKKSVWGVFQEAVNQNEDLNAYAALSVYEKYATRAEQLDFVIKRAYARL